MSQNRVNPHRLRSGFYSPSPPAEASLHLGELELVNSSTQQNPLSLTLLCLQSIVYVVIASRGLEIAQLLKIKSHFVAKNAEDNLSTRGLKYPLLVKRLACLVISGAASADSLDILQPAILSPEMIIQMEKEFGLLRSALQKAHITDEQTAFLTKEWYTGVLARIRINAFRIELAGGLYEDLLSSAAAAVESEGAVGNAVYMLPSFYNHDCDPNVHIVWIENVDARLKALRDIEAGEELRICYIDASMDHGARQTLLFQGFGFQCQCLRCLSGD